MWSAVAAAGILGTFVLPFAFPLRIPVFSPVYTAGGNNRAGAVILAAISLATTLACWRLGVFSAPPPQRTAEREKPITLWVWACTAAVVLSAALLGVLMVREGTYYADAGYFLTQLRTGLDFHKTLYRDFEFAYGPLLYSWPAAFIQLLRPLHVGAAAAYVVSLCVMEAVGAALLFYSISAMRVSRSTKMAAFLFFSIICLDPQEGLNYTTFRFVFPIAMLVLLSRQVRLQRAALVSLAGCAASLAVSPELGVAFAAGAICYGGYRAVIGTMRWMSVGVAAAIGGLLFSAIVGGDYFRTLREFATGGYNMLLEPAPHICLLLLCALVPVPMVVAEAIARRGESDGELADKGLLIGLYVAGLALLPAALGRCDPLHVSFNGWPLYLLTAVALDRMGPLRQRAGLAVGMLFCLYSVVQEYALGSGSVVKLAAQVPDPLEDVDFAKLRNTVAGGHISFPWYIPMRAVDDLTASGNYHPLYLCIPAVNGAAEQRSVENMREAEFAMVPRFYDLVVENKINNVGMKFRMRFGYRYKKRHEPYLQGALLAHELKTHWQDAGSFGPYELYRKLQ